MLLVNYFLRPLSTWLILIVFSIIEKLIRSCPFSGLHWSPFHVPEHVKSVNLQRSTFCTVYFSSALSIRKTLLFSFHSLTGYLKVILNKQMKHKKEDMAIPKCRQNGSMFEFSEKKMYVRTAAKIINTFICFSTVIFFKAALFWGW